MMLNSTSRTFNAVSETDLQNKPMTNEHINEAIASLETLMYETVNSDVTVLRDAARHILSAGGKRIRPRLILLTYAALGGQNFNSVLPVAAAIELVHTASVVHDDINDHGVVRRGRPSVNALWGRTFALLTGDFLFTKVYELMAPYKDLNIDFAEGTIALVEGETMQAAAVKENNFSRAVYYEIIARKTAALFRSGAKLGAKLAEASSDKIEVFANFGFNLGLAFQIIDDVLDLIGDEAQLGKTSGIDVEQGRGFAIAYENTQNNNTTDPLQSIKERALKGDAVKEAQEQAQQLVNSAIESLDAIADSPAKTALIELANSVIKREY